MATKIAKRPGRSGGFTLIELLLVVAMISILVCVASWGSQKWIADWRLRQAGQQLYEYLKQAQANAENTGSLVLSNGLLLSRKTFLVFEQSTNSYAGYRWQDDNGNGLSENNENTLLWRSTLPQGITYDFSPDVNRRACSNVNNSPNHAVTFSSPDDPPCNDRPCIKFDHNGFSVMGPGAVYLSDGQRSFAITATRPGHFTMCEWKGHQWR